jgi:hypothetical protein
MTKAEEASLSLTPRVYMIQGERNEGETRDPPIAPISAVTESHAVAEYMRLHGKRRVRSLTRPKSFLV